MSYLKLKNISKKYGSIGLEHTILEDISLKINRGEIVAIMGPSGSGKTTLLNIIGCLDNQTEGEYFLDGININTLSKSEIAKIRNNKIGFVFQQFALIQEFSAIENVQMPLILSNTYKNLKQRIKFKQRKEKCEDVLTKLGLKEHINKKPSQLSGGQQQRVAIARALVNNPQLILADEPTGALDQKNSKEVMKILKEINNSGTTVIVITHDDGVASYCDRIINILDGKLIN